MKMQPVATQNIQINNADNKNNVANRANYVKPFAAAEKCPDASSKVKVGSAITTFIGVAAAMLFTFKSLSKCKTPEVLKEVNNIKDVKSIKDYLSNIVRIKYDEDKHELGKAVGCLGVGSVVGGFTGGVIFDKRENRRAKFREAIIQLVGNVAIPLLCVETLGQAFKRKVSPKITKALGMESHKILKEVPGVLATGGILVSAILVGNRVANLLNSDIFDINDDRKLKVTDMLPHIDDVCMALSLMFGDTPISKAIPAALMIAGYSVGTAQEKPHIKREFAAREAHAQQMAALKHHNHNT